MSNGAMALQITPSAGTYFNRHTRSGELVARGDVYSVYGENYSPLARQGQDSFVTFCLEVNQSFINGYSYNAEINNAAVNGGSGNSDPNRIVGQDRISQGTAYLYSLFASGTLTGYDYTPAHRLSDAIALQNAIWWLEDEIALTNPNNNKFIHLVNNGMFTGGRGAQADYNGDSVKVMNLTGPIVGRYVATTDCQDMLVYVGGPNVHVPDGGLTVAMLGFGLAGLSAVGRRVRKS
jgi:hypothetical protein